eukprot:SAG11_NODE_300_length_11057_cov_5.223469_11_plen_41_part_00
MNVRERKLEGGGSAWELEWADARWGRPGEVDNIIDNITIE